MKNHHEEIINAHLKNENHEEFLRKDYRQNMLWKDIIIDKRMSGKKKDDCKYQGEFTRHRRQNSMYHMKKYSRRGDWMKVRHPDEKRIVETENLKETSLINHMITVLTDEKQIWQEWLYPMFLLKQACMKIWSMTVYYIIKDHRSNRRSWDRKEAPRARKGRWSHND